jgi:hypothetical protein
MEVTLSSLEELIKMILTHINISLDSKKTAFCINVVQVIKVALFSANKTMEFLRLKLSQLAP